MTCEAHSTSIVYACCDKACGTGAVGLYLAMTGSRLKSPQDLLYAGLGTHYVPSGQLPALRASLRKPLERQPDRQQGLEQLLTRLEPHARQVLIHLMLFAGAEQTSIIHKAKLYWLSAVLRWT